MRIVFLGTSDFAVPILEALVNHGHEVLCVYTPPPKHAGRGMRSKKNPPVYEFAVSHDLPIKTPENLLSEDVFEHIKGLKTDFIIVVSYGKLIPSSIINLPKFACVNVHASLLPRWRGADPIRRAIMEGDDFTGVCLMRAVEALDGGPVYCTRKVKITDDMTFGDLHNALSTIGSDLLLESLPGIISGSLDEEEQDDAKAVYAKKLQSHERKIDWCMSAEKVHCLIHSLSPEPGAWFIFGKEKIQVLKCSLEDYFYEEEGEPCSPGQVLDNMLLVACGDCKPGESSKAIRLLSLKREGKKTLDAKTFLNGLKIKKFDFCT